MRYRFGGFELDESAFELRKDGEPISIAPLPLNLLLELLRAHPAAPSKQELMEALWPDTYVAEASLSQAVRAARVALGEGRDGSVLQTVRGRGFRIGVDVTTDAPASDDAVEPAPARPIFGRDAELGQMRRVLDTVLTGQPQFLILKGEPGIGKSHLAEKIAEEARERSVQTLVGRGLEGDREPAFWPFVQILRSHAARIPVEHLVADLGSGAAAIARVVPEIAERLPRGLQERDEAPDPDTERFAFFDAVTAFIGNAARREPLMLLLEDLHWADESSLLLLDYLTQELASVRLLVVATTREAESANPALGATLAAVARSPHGSQTLLLGGLEREALSRLVEDEIGESPSPALLETLVERTEGNPLFARQLAQLVTRAPDGDGGLEVPPGVQPVIRQRLAELDEGTRALLGVASTIGREFDLVVLARATGRSPADLLDDLDPAEQARLVEPGETTGRLRFVHGLVCESLYGDLSTRDRVRAHLSVAEALEAIHARQPERVLSELASHFAAALPASGAERAFDYARRAAEQDLRLLAFEQAIPYAELALQIADGSGEVPASERAGALRTLADARFRAGRREAAAQAWWELVALARAEDDAATLADAAESIALVSVFTAHSNAETVSLMREALERLGDEATPRRARLLSHLARQLTWTPESDLQDALTREAVEMARKLSDRDTLLDVLGSRGSVLELVGGDAAREETYEELLAEARRVGSRIFQADALTLRLQHRVERADSLGVDRDLAALERIADDLHHPLYASHVARARAARALWRGDVRDAERLIEEAAALGAKQDPEHATVALTAQVGALRRLQGRLDELEAGARATAEAYPALAAFRTGLASIEVERGRLDEARRLFEELSRDDFHEVVDQRVHRGLNLALLTEICAALDDAQAAAVLERILLPDAGRYLTVSNTLTTGCASRCLGVLASVQGRHEEAVERLEEALEVERRMGADAWLATTWIELARARIRAGDPTRAASAAQEALAVAEARGMDGPLGIAQLLCRGTADAD